MGHIAHMSNNGHTCNSDRISFRMPDTKYLDKVAEYNLKRFSNFSRRNLLEIEPLLLLLLEFLLKFFSIHV